MSKDNPVKVCHTYTKAAAEEFKQNHPEAAVYYSEGAPEGAWKEVPTSCCPGGEAGKCICPEKHPDQLHCPTPGPPKYVCGSDDCKRGCPETETV